MRLDISHHFGPATCFFLETSDTTKLIIMGQGASHPKHWHPHKDETFTLLWGDMTVNGLPLNQGEPLMIRAREPHEFSSVGGCVVEENATVNDVSFYENQLINRMPREERKTYIEL